MSRAAREADGPILSSGSGKATRGMSWLSAGRVEADPRAARAGAGASHHRDDDVPRDGDDVLVGEGGARDRATRLMRWGDKPTPQRTSGDPQANLPIPGTTVAPSYSATAVSKRSL